jgi:hypothetical protein
MSLMHREIDSNSDDGDFEEMSDIDDFDRPRTNRTVDRTDPVVLRRMGLDKDIDNFIMSKDFSSARREGAREFNTSVALGHASPVVERPPHIERLMRTLQEQGRRGRSNSQMLSAALQSVFTDEDEDL